MSADEREQKLKAEARIWYNSPESVAPFPFEMHVKERLGWEVSVSEACEAIQSITDGAKSVEEILAMNPQI